MFLLLSFPRAYNNLGNALKDKGMVKEAIHCYITACRLMPTFAVSHSNLGSLLKEQGSFEQAIAHFEEAVKIDPMFADAYSNMGNAYKEAGKLDEAIKCYTTAIKLKPEFADAYANLASAYKDGGRFDDAITCYRQALKLKPDFPTAFANLVHALVMICDWRSRDEDLKKLFQIVVDQIDTGDSNVGGVVTTLPCVQPFHSIALPLSLSQMYKIARLYSQYIESRTVLMALPKFRFRAKKPHQRLKIGYVSSDFGNHPIGFSMASVFKMHDRTRFECFCYSLSPDDKSLQRRTIADDAEHFKEIAGVHSSDAARLIHSDGIHILINLNGYTKGSRNEIFALQPAPIQVRIFISSFFLLSGSDGDFCILI